MEDVAREANVSRALVSLVIHDSPKVSEERRERVLAAINKLGYRPNAMARSLASRRTNTLGVMLNDLNNPFFTEIAASLERQASADGMRVLMTTGGRDPQRERAMLEALMEYRADGIVIASPVIKVAEIAAITDGTATVMISRSTTNRAIDCVITNEAHGAKLAVDHLVELGHESIVHIDGRSAASSSGRRTGYKRAMKAAGLERHIRVLPGQFTEEAGVLATRSLLAEAERTGKMPTAIFAGNDLQACGALDTLEGAGLRVPEDVSLIGFDNTFLASLSHMSLTTIDQPRAEIGRVAVRLIRERLAGRRTQAVRRTVPTLVPRSTTGPAPTRPATDATGTDARRGVSVGAL